MQAGMPALLEKHFLELVSFAGRSVAKSDGDRRQPMRIFTLIPSSEKRGMYMYRTAPSLMCLVAATRWKRRGGCQRKRYTYLWKMAGSNWWVMK